MSCGWFVKLRTFRFHEYKVHVRADTRDGGKCLCGLVVNKEAEGGGGVGALLLSGLGQGGKESGRGFFLGWGWGIPRIPSGAQGELVLLDGLFDPGPQAGLVESLYERLLGRVVLCGRLLGFVVRAGLEHLDAQDGRQLGV